MFESLSDRIREDEGKVNSAERYIRWGAVILISALLFGGLYLGVRFLEG